MGWLKRTLYGISDYAKDRLDQGKAAEAARKAQEEAARLAQQVQEAARIAQQEAARKAQEAAQRAREEAARLAQQAREEAEKRAQQAAPAVQEIKNRVEGAVQKAVDQGKAVLETAAEKGKTALGSAIDKGVENVNQWIDNGQNQINSGAEAVKGQLGIETVQPTKPDPETGTVTTPPAESAPVETPVEQAPPTETTPVVTPSTDTTPVVTPSTDTGTSSTPPVEQEPVVRPVTQVDIAKEHMAAARQNVYDVLNKKFQYSEKSSPLYSILQKQYAKQAEKAAGEAYARSVANTGGYGSSYATMTAEEARRQTMEGFNDQQMELYQAARDEFLTERQSAVDWYNQAKQLYADTLDEELIGAYDAAYETWDGTNENEVRSALLAQGVSASNVNTIMTKIKNEKLAGMQTDAQIADITQKEVYNSAYDAGSVIWNGSNETDVREALLAQGVPASTVNEVISKLKGEYASSLETDQYIEGVKKTQAYNTAMDIARGLWNSTEDEADVREALDGYSNTVIDAVISELKGEYASSLETDQYIEGVKKTQAYNTAMNTARGLWNGSNEAEVKSALSTYSNTIVDAILRELKGEYAEDVLTDKELESIRKSESYENALNAANGSWTVGEGEDAETKTWSSPADDAALREHLTSLGYDNNTISAVLREKKSEYIEDVEIDDYLSERTDRQQAKDAWEDAAALWVEGKTNAEIEAAITETYGAAVAKDVMSALKGEQLADREQDAAMKEMDDRESYNAAMNAASGSWTVGEGEDAETKTWSSPADDAALREHLESLGYDATTVNNVLRDKKLEYVENVEIDEYLSSTTDKQKAKDAWEDAAALWVEGKTNAEIEAAITETYGAAVAKDVMSAMREEQLTESEQNATLEDQEHRDSYNDALEVANGMWSSPSDDESLRERLQSDGYSSTVINEILRTKKAEYIEGIEIDDYLSERTDRQQAKDAWKMATEMWANDSDNAEIETAVRSLYGYDVATDIMSALRDTQIGKNDQNAALGEQARQEAYNKGAGIAAESWKSPADDTAVRARMKEAGIDDATINSVLRDKKLEYAENMEIDQFFKNVSDQGKAEVVWRDALDLWYAGKTNDEIRAELLGKYGSVLATDAMTALRETQLAKAEQETTQEAIENPEPEITVENANAYLLENFDSYNEATMRAALKAQGVPDDVIEESMEATREVFKATVTDTSAQVTDMSSAISYKGTLDAARANGTMTVEEYDEAIQKNGQVIIDQVTKNINDPTKLDYLALGFTADEWNAMEDGDKRLATYEALGQMAKDGTVTHSQYEKFMRSEIQEELNSKEFKESKQPVRDAADIATVIQDLYESGYLLKDSYIDLMYNEVVPKVENTALFKSIVDAVGKFRDAYGEKEEIAIGHMKMYGIGNRDGEKEWKHMSDEQKEVLLEIAIFKAQGSQAVTSKPIKGGDGSSRPTGNSTVTENAKR